MKLSILTPAVPSRLAQLSALCAQLEKQIGALPVEHLVLLDNKRRTVGGKRDALLRAARGQYVAFVDDDDDVSEDYVANLLDAIAQAPDVVTFRQFAAVNGDNGVIEFRLGNENEAFHGIWGAQTEAPIIKRNAWHVCAWRRSLAICSRFPDSNYGEDWAFAAPLCEVAKTQVHIPKVLHYYRHSTATTEAPPPV